MKKVKVCSALSLVLLLVVVCGIGIAEKKPEDKTVAITIRNVKEQVVLYTIYRGDYAKIGPAIGKLFGLMGQQRMVPQGRLMMAYLNNPKRVSREHWLTEIRIPVAKNALEKAGTLGKYTDVKTLPAMDVAVAIKPVGMAEPAPIYTAIGSWIPQNGYMACDGPIETCFAQGPIADYSQAKSEIMIPVMKAKSK